MSEVEYLQCPFCKEKDFDAIGLKLHFVLGYCDDYNQTELKDKPYEYPPKPKMADITIINEDKNPSKKVER